MRDFETYFQIFLVRHKDDKNFPSIIKEKMTTKESINLLKDYFEDFWEESQKNSGVRNEDKIKILKNQIKILENKLFEMEEELYSIQNDIILI